MRSTQLGFWYGSARGGGERGVATGRATGIARGGAGVDADSSAGMARRTSGCQDGGC